MQIKRNSKGKFASLKPSFMTDEEYKIYKLEKKRFNDRVAKQTKRLMTRTGETDAAQLARIGAVEWKITGTPKTKKAYQAQMNFFRETTSPAYKRKKKVKIENRNLEVLDYTYHLHPDAYQAIAEKFHKMSNNELIEWSYRHKDLIRDFFEEYKRLKEGEVFSADHINDKVKEIMESLKIEMKPEWML